MYETTASTHVRLFAILLATIALVSIFSVICSRSIDASASSPTARQAANSERSTLASHSQSTRALRRVTIVLSAYISAADARQIQADLIGPQPGSSAARALAAGSPHRSLPAERVIAGRMDAHRNKALARFRAAARRANASSEQVARAIKRLGGRVLDASIFPNSITAAVPANRLAQVHSLPGVLAVRGAVAPIWASSILDGSQAWHDNSFNGSGPSADGLGGPDFVAFDKGTRVSHQAFRTRLPSDLPNTGLGSGPTSRITSPAGRANFDGTAHGNIIAATVAATDLNTYATGDPLPYPANWQTRKGLAYGLDEVYDPFEANSQTRWELGIEYLGEPGVTDLPEVGNFSAGDYEDSVDSNPSWSFIDAKVSQFGITQTISAGNCGLLNGTYFGTQFEDCETSAHRVSTPGNNYNTITVGGLVQGNPNDISTWSPWPNSSPGPTFGARKKPDLIAPPASMVGVPSSSNDTGYGSPLVGTSFAAPQAAAGAILLASAGVYQPTAQKSILINTATPIQGQTYWTPTSGWGALNLDGAFSARGYYQSSEVTADGPNGARFFKQTGVTAGDRTTLVWNRRLGNFAGSSAPAGLPLTDLDLSQLDFSTGAPTASGGVDANESSDTNQSASAANPMPSNSSGSDGTDNVEQTRSTANGTEIYKVEAQSSIVGAASEPFSIAGAHPIDALQSPIPEVTLSAAPVNTGPGALATITASVTNPSADLALANAEVTLNLPASVNLTTGSPTIAIGSLEPDETDVRTWTVAGTMEGVHSLSADATGTTYDEPFEGSGGATLTIDGTSPVVTINAPAPYSETANVPVSWSATDNLTGIDHYDVEIARDGSSFTSLLANTSQTATTISGAEGEALHLRVRAIDGAGNSSASAAHDVTVDAIPVSVSVGVPVRRAGKISIPVSVVNVGSPTNASYSFSPTTSDEVAPLTTNVVTYTNTSAKTARPILVIGAADGLGRAASFILRYTVAPARASANLKILRARKSGQFVRVSGRIARKATGNVTISAVRIGEVGTIRAARKSKIRNGRFSSKMRLATGKYRFKASYSGSKSFAPGTSKRTVSIH